MPRATVRDTTAIPIPRSVLSVMALCFHFDIPVPRSELSVMALCFHFDIPVPRSELSTDNWLVVGTGTIWSACLNVLIPFPNIVHEATYVPTRLCPYAVDRTRNAVTAFPSLWAVC